jgi:hypothetical protein
MDLVLSVSVSFKSAKAKGAGSCGRGEWCSGVQRIRKRHWLVHAPAVLFLRGFFGGL